MHKGWGASAVLAFFPALTALLCNWLFYMAFIFDQKMISCVGR
jgi:hypothetical protein